MHFKTTLLSYNIIVVTLLHTFKIELMVKQLGFSVSFCLFHHSACLFTPIPPWWRRALSPDCPGNMCQSLLSVSYEVCHMVSIRFSFIMVAIYHIWTFTFLKIYCVNINSQLIISQRRRLPVMIVQKFEIFKNITVQNLPAVFWNVQNQWGKASYTRLFLICIYFFNCKNLSCS